jgi:hypothetical protein
MSTSRFLHPRKPAILAVTPEEASEEVVLVVARGFIT